ncbi:hypothetical protein KR032_004488, partial [Drosophila birchii]
MLGERKKAFANPNEALPYNTSVVATIRTTSEEPIYAKLYPYPMGKMRLVLDFRKLNERTIPDRYPMPNISMILGNLGKANGAKMFYKPGKENLVADALSRQQLNVVEQEEAYSCAVTIHSEMSLTHTIEFSEKPLNCFQNQITLKEARFPAKRSFVLFGNKRRHNISFTCKESLLEELADIIVPKGVNAIHCDLHTLAMIQDDLVRQFPATKFWHC